MLSTEIMYCTVTKWSKIWSMLEKQYEFQPRVFSSKTIIQKINKKLRHLDIKNTNKTQRIYQ